MEAKTKETQINFANTVGFTTGTCAAAAAKAACYRLVSGRWLEYVAVITPSKIKANLRVADKQNTNDFAKCSVVKPLNDDPDITAGIKVFASANYLPQTNKKNTSKYVEIVGGDGVGIVTKPGLSVEIGKWAINPVPMKMIEREVKGIISPGDAVKITISIPDGSKIASKTFNSRLGIKDGLSILGTTGIVKPMSNEAIKTTLSSQIDIAIALGFKKIALVPGSIGKKGALTLSFKEDSIISCSNFIGYMLTQCVKKKIKNISLVGHLGKLLKLYGGSFDTHHSKSPLNLSLLFPFLNKNEIKILNTAEQAIDILLKKNENQLNEIASLINKKATEYVKGKIKINTYIVNMKSKIVGRYEE